MKAPGGKWLSVWRGLAAAALLVAASLSAHAEETASSGSGTERQEVDQSVAEYERVSREITLSEERKASLAAEIAESKRTPRRSPPR